jgi:HSP20 family protein
MSLVLRNNARTKWNPFQDLEREIDRIVGERPVRSALRGWAPAVDVQETDEAYALYADLPGLSKEDITISVEDNAVTIRGERKRAEEHKDDEFQRVERSFGVFERTFTVRDGFDAGKVEAKFKDGVLTLTLPKLEERKPRQIEVKVS